MVSRFGMLSLSIIPLFLFTAVVVLALRAVVIAITPPRRGVKVPSCEKCRYPVAGLTALACPNAAPTSAPPASSPAPWRCAAAAA